MSETRQTQGDTHLDDGDTALSFLERIDQGIRRSAVFRSIFRQPYPNDERSRAMAVMNRGPANVTAIASASGR